MSYLPQRKKSAEEINKLRESLGVPGSALPDESPSAPPPAPERTPHPEPPAGQEIDTLVATRHAAEVVHETPPPPETAAPLPVPRSFAPRENHSLKRSEHVAQAEDASPSSVRAPKQVRSLRRSEREPVSAPTPSAGPATSALPNHRHSDEEIAEMRRREMLTMAGAPPPNPKFSAAHLGVVIPGYLLAAIVWLPLADTLYLSLNAGAGWSFLGQPAYPIAIPAAAALIALLIASFVFLKKPISRHHAAFITAITVFALVFEALHYFPQLRHAT